MKKQWIALPAACAATLALMTGCGMFSDPEPTATPMATPRVTATVTMAPLPTLALTPSPEPALTIEPMLTDSQEPNVVTPNPEATPAPTPASTVKAKP